MMSSNRAGRPPVANITDALRKAAERAMVAVGYSGMSVDGLVTEAGTTRPAFYRRYPSLAHLVFEVIRDQFGQGQPVDAGSLRDDLLTLQRADITMFASPLIHKNLPGLLEVMSVNESIGKLYHDEFVAPRRANVARILDLAAQRGEVDPSRVDVDLICDVLVGPILSRTLLPIQAGLNDRLARDLVEIVLQMVQADKVTPSR
ncbi:Bacterial regulatory protein, tetR family [Microbacterium azadirachtae]|uniref:Bacterial regulatory protein, tetR family n=1 Tax=Microbacterium azadirachtae TaxID=582680 RepID=A0A0F0KFX1_9MICO|nr:Bacterial regulatory protein, tetR family [Microbacterium azadirachtae]